MERKVGDKFGYAEVTLEVVEHHDCLGCYFHKNYIRCNNDTVSIACNLSTERNAIGHCSAIHRKDKKNIIFKEVK